MLIKKINKNRGKSHVFLLVFKGDKIKYDNYQGTKTMKKSTFAVAALLTALSTIPMVSVAYAEEAAAPAASTCQGAGCKAASCQGADADKSHCNGSSCGGSCGGNK